MAQAVANTRKGSIEYRLDERLAGEGFSVLTPSRPGYDDTPSSVGRTAEEAADALAALLDALAD